MALQVEQHGEWRLPCDADRVQLLCLPVKGQRRLHDGQCAIILLYNILIPACMSSFSE